MTDHDRHAKEPIPRWAKWLIILACVVIIPAGVVHLLGRAATARWMRYAETLRAGGDPLTFKEIEAKRRVIPDRQNSALLFESLLPEVSQVGNIKPDKNVLVFATRSTDADFFTGISRDTVEPSRAFRDAARPLLDKLAPLRDMPLGRMEIDYPDENTTILRMMLPNLGSLRTVSKLAHLDGMMKLIDGHTEEAAATFAVQTGVAGVLHEHPTVIGRLVQMAIDALAMQTVEDTLRVGELEDDTIVSLTGTLDAVIASSTMKWGLLGERAMFVEICDEVFAGNPGAVRDFDVSASGPSVSLLPTMLIRQNQMRGAEMHTRLINAAGDPVALIKAANGLDMEIPNLPPTQVLTRIFMPSLSRAAVLDVRLSAEMRCTRAGLAAERFRLAHGRLPTSLAELVPDFLDAVPEDPFDRQPMRFAVTDKGIVIYSIGGDGTDDGGLVAQQKKRPHTRDVGFRLYKPEHRGLLLVDPPAQGND